jgi:hypothetical protein
MSLRDLRAAALAGLALVTGCAALLVGCRPPAGKPSTAVTTRDAGIRFRRVTEAAGIGFRHENGESGRKYFPEWLGGGAAMLDYDNDGWLDLFLVNGGRLPGWSGKEAPRDRLYRNNRDGTFTDVTDAAGIKTRHYGVGCAVGDYDGNGFPDLYVTGFEGNVLYRNRGDGTFADQTAAARVQPGGLCSGTAFGDYDDDGDLDLYVCRYVRYRLADNIECRQSSGTERHLVMCRQLVYEPAPDVLYRNDGDRGFTDVTRSSGVAVQPGRGLGVLFTDFDGDRRQDLFVANDLTPDFLFCNQGDGRLREEALERGAAFNLSGAPQAGMGVAAGDVDRDGLVDLVVTNFANEYTRFCRQQPDHRFEDTSASAGLVESTNRYVGFGVGLEDFDRDGWLDLFIANGHVSEEAERFYEGMGLKEPKVVLRGGDGKFSPVPEPWADERTGEPRVGRGAAFGDVDNDGDTDVLVNNLHDVPDLLLNETPRAGHWLQLQLRGRGKGQLAIGARVVIRVGGQTQVREVRSGGSYCSQNDLRPLFGLGEATMAERVEVTWPDGRGEEWSTVNGDRLVQLTQGSGKPAGKRSP